MGQMKTKKNVPMWAKLDHPKPTTRREFLATGLIPFAAWAVGPSLSTVLFSSAAHALTSSDCAATGPTFIPFITLNLSGGPSLASQLVVKDINGQNLSSYTKVGLGTGPGLSFNIEKEFGGVEFAGTAIGGTTTGLVSNFLTGMRDPLNAGKTTNTSLANTAFIWNTVSLQDDTATNLLDVTGLVTRMGLAGSKLPNLGTVDSATGISQHAAVLPPPAPFVVGSVNDLTNALGYASALAGMTTKQKTALAKVISNLSGPQIAKITSMTGANVLSQAMQCAGIRNVDLVSTGGGDVNPLALGNQTSTDLAGIWGVNANDRTSQNAVFGSMVYNALVGNASTVNLNMGGYDYHDGTRTTGNAKDLAAGQVVGKILQTAAYLKRPVFVYVCADGATVSAESATADSPWMSDRGIAGMQYMLAFDPAQRPSTSANNIGAFNAGQAADGKIPTSTSAELAAQAVFANYAVWNGRMDYLLSARILGGDMNLINQTVKLHKS